MRGLELPALESLFGRYGVRLYELALEDTFPEDVLLAETEPMIRRLAEKLWSASRKESRVPRTVVLKLKTREFKTLTRSHTPNSPPSSCEELTETALRLRERIDLGRHRRYRLVGVGLSNFQDAEERTPAHTIRVITSVRRGCAQLLLHHLFRPFLHLFGRRFRFVGCR